LISPEIIERIREALPLVEYIARDTVLKKAGSVHKGLCPFHNERTPSFVVYQNDNRYHCFGCGKGGDIFAYVEERNHLSFGEAVRFLAEQAGIAIPERGAREDAEYARSRRLVELNERALELFRHALKALPAGRKALDYLVGRGLGEEAIDRFKLGYALPQWAALSSRLLEEHYEASSLIEIGLARPDKESGGVRDYFRDRIIFPIYDERGRLAAFGGRVLGEGEPKYLNSPETPVFKKRAVLYGFNLARKAIGDLDFAIIVEGYMDVIGLYQAGVQNAVAPLGTALTREHLERLARVSKRVVFLFDGDKAGRRAAFAAARPALELGLSARVVLMEENQDAFDLSLARTGEEILARTRRGIPLVDFVLNNLYQETISLAGEDSLAFLERVYAYIEDIREEARVSLFLQKAALLAGANPEELELDFRKRKRRSPAGEIGADKKKLQASSSLTKFPAGVAEGNFELYLLRLAGLHPSAWASLAEEFERGLRLEDTEARLVEDALRRLAADAPTWSGAAFLGAMPTEALREVVGEDLASGRLEIDWEKQIADTIDTLWARIVRKERKLLDGELQRQKLVGDENAIQDLQNRILALRRREDALKSKARKQK